MCSKMPLDALRAELQRREIVLQIDGPKLIAIDAYQRLSPALEASIRAHRELLAAALRPVSAALRPLQMDIDNTLVGTDLYPIIENTEAAFMRGEITREEAEALAQAATDKSRQIPASIEEMPLEDFATSGLVQKVKSKVLGETVIWAADNAQVPPETHQVVYRVCELRELGGMPAEWLQRLHVAKKTLNAKLIAAENDNEYEMIRV